MPPAPHAFSTGRCTPPLNLGLCPPTRRRILIPRCCSLDAEGRSTTVTIDVAGEGFSASGLVVTARNFLDVYPYQVGSVTGAGLRSPIECRAACSLPGTAGACPPPCFTPPTHSSMTPEMGHSP